jgi:hypothetical protein
VIEFIRRAGGLWNLEDKNMFEMALKKNCGVSIYIYQKSNTKPRPAKAAFSLKAR